MKLTQNVARQPGTPQSGAIASPDRFDRLEQRLERLERIPIAAPEAAPGPEPVGFARKVIETVVQAVDERLNEYAKQMERRLAEFEARIAEVRSQFDAEIVAVHDRVEGGMQGLTESEEKLREEIRRVADSSSGSDASAAEAAIEIKLAPLRVEVTEMRQRLAESDRTVAEIVAVQHRVEWDMQGFAESEEKLREEIRRVADSSSSFDASAAETAIEMKLAPLRVEIAEMRQRLAESDRTALDLILAIGQMCRQAAGRIADSEPLPPESAPPLSNAEPPLNGTGDSLRAALEEPGVSMDPPFESAAPAFTQLKKATSLWRVPAVSSFLLATGSLLLLHYL
jgi:small-conductance mechanosensitive channel